MKVEVAGTNGGVKFQSGAYREDRLEAKVDRHLPDRCFLMIVQRPAGTIKKTDAAVKVQPEAVAEIAQAMRSAQLHDASTVVYLAHPLIGEGEIPSLELD